MKSIDIQQLEFECKRILAEREFAEFVKQAWIHSDTRTLTWNFHMQIICDLLQKVSEGKIKKLLINIPPGTGKSVLTAVYWLAWDWIAHPERYIIYATYAANLSNRFAKKHRDLVKSDWYQIRWGAGTPANMVINKENTQRKQEFENNCGGGRFSTGKTGEVTGRRANIILFDDLNKVQDATGKTGVVGSEIQKGVEYLSETLWTRRILTKEDIDKTAVVGICQRIHHADVAQWCINRGDFVHLNLPMEAVYDNRTLIYCMPDGSYQSCQGDIEANQLLSEGGTLFFEDGRADGALLFPELINERDLEDIKTSLGPTNYSAQYQQEPTQVGGSLIDPSNIKEYDIETEGNVVLNGTGSAIISVDATFTANQKSDFVVIQFWKEYRGKYYLFDQIRARMGVNDTVKSIIDMHSKWDCPKRVVIEEAANGYAAIELLNNLLPSNKGLLVQGYKPKLSKVARVEFAAPTIQAGNVFFPSVPGFDMRALKNELLHFPLGKNDDCVDALSMALIYFLQNNAEKQTIKTKALYDFYSRH